MLDFPRWKVWLTALTCIFGVLLAVPSLMPERMTAGLPSFANQRINLGLDLAGGSQLLLEAQTSDVAKQRLEQMEDTIRRQMRSASPKIDIAEVSTAGGSLAFSVRDPSQAAQAARVARDQTQPAGTLGGADWDVRIEGNRITMTQTEAGLADAVDRDMNVATEVVRRRIDELGTREPTIIRQGTNRIVVQVPGLSDPQQLRALLGRTARLEFKMVDLTASPDQLAAGRAPVGSQILSSQEGGRIAVLRRAIVTGERIADASQQFDPETNEPNVSIRFDGAGSRAFARVTQENVGKPFAIVLDNVVLSAPRINEPILGGSARITGSFTVESANELAVALRSGSLPVDLRVVQEQSVGPELGRESIEKGVTAGIIATGLVLLFMLVTYGRFGVYANIALVLNALLILAVMAVFNSSLTLPGIAGFVLTIGAAVDANVIINERIREEQRRGRRILDALEHGYNEARTAIFDANITNVIAGVLLFYFGSGPVRGFALVLIIGIVTSVFTAVTVTRMFVSIWLRKRPQQLVI
jgi:preprotein translocase subunit SecD